MGTIGGSVCVLHSLSHNVLLSLVFPARLFGRARQKFVVFDPSDDRVGGEGRSHVRSHDDEQGDRQPAIQVLFGTPFSCALNIIADLWSNCWIYGSWIYNLLLV